jgi:hypothetical protein
MADKCAEGEAFAVAELRQYMFDVEAGWLQTRR